MTNPLSISRLNTAARALKDGAATSWSVGHLKEAARLFAKAEIIESKAHYLELAEMAREDEELRAVMKGGRALG